jgi:hypothetical protein
LVELSLVNDIFSRGEKQKTFKINFEGLSKWCTGGDGKPTKRALRLDRLIKKIIMI